MVIMSMHYLQHYITGIIKGKPIADVFWYHIMLRTHIIFGISAILIAPTQFSKKMRLKSITWHKRIGYIYVISVFLSSCAGLIVAQFAIGGFTSTLGFSLLAIVWFVSTFFGLRYAIRNDIKNHHKWMIRSFALTFSAIPQRLMLLMAFSPYIDFTSIYKLSAWLSWIFNLLVAEWIIRKMTQKHRIKHTS